MSVWRVLAQPLIAAMTQRIVEGLMAISYRRAGIYLPSILKSSGVDELAARLRPRKSSLSPAVHFEAGITPEAVAKR